MPKKEMNFSKKGAKDFVKNADLKKNAGKSKRSEAYVAVYFSKKEKDRILELAGKKGLSASSFIRSVLKEQKLI